MADPHALLLEAKTVLSTGDLDRAEQLCRALLKETTPPPDASLVLGVVYYRRGRAEDALPWFKKAHDEDPRLDQVCLWLSRTLRRLGRKSEALSFALDAKESGGPDSAVFHHLGLCQMDCREFVAASASFRQAIQLDPSAAVLHQGLGLALSRAGDSASAAKALRESLRLDPSSGNNILHEAGPVK
jgi:Flp pilus assembly protein TadD